MKVFIVIQHLHDTQGAVYVFSTRTTMADAEKDKEAAYKDTQGGYLSWVEIVESEVKGPSIASPLAIPCPSCGAKEGEQCKRVRANRYNSLWSHRPTTNQPHLKRRLASGS